MTIINLGFLVEAKEGFQKASLKASQGEPISEDDCPMKYFAALGFAHTVLSSFGVRELHEMSREEVVHPSTVLGGSLDNSICYSALYLGNGTDLNGLSRDDFEQFYRSCGSAEKVLRRELSGYFQEGDISP